MKLKSTIRDAMTPMKPENVDDISLEMELEGKNEVLHSTEKRIDCLLQDIGIATKGFSEKDNIVENLSKTISSFEQDKRELKKKLNSMEAYINQMEEALCHELKRRRQIENDHKSLQKETKTLAHNYKTKVVHLEK